jgi:DNA-binding CsgD family transcriptional regulator
MAIGVGEIQRKHPAANAAAEFHWITGDQIVDIRDLRKTMDHALRIGWSWPAGSIALWLWKLGELSEAPLGIAEPYRLVIGGDPLAAAAILAKLDMPYERAIALTHGDTEAGLKALEILDDLGATAVADKLRQELRDEGLSVPRRRRSRTDATVLTARQAEVLELLAEGHSNSEIADQLFLSPRTVEHHVAAIMSKLDASSRGEAVYKAGEAGLLTP